MRRTALLITAMSSPYGFTGFGRLAPPNIISSGTGPLASAGVTTTILISTLMEGQAELSTWPMSCLALARIMPTYSISSTSTVQVTSGTFSGTRPYTSRSKSSTISGLLTSHHCLAVVTFFPALVFISSGITGKGLALLSS